MKRGTIVLTPFPFTDLSGQKVRPALVVSRSDRPGSDVVLAFITAYRGHPLLTTDLLVEDSHPDFAQTGLKKSSVIKLDKKEGHLYCLLGASPLSEASDSGLCPPLTSFTV